MCETKICVDCIKELPLSEFRVHKKKYKLSSGEVKYSPHRVTRCKNCLKRYGTQKSRARKEGRFEYTSKDDYEFYNYDKVKCYIVKVNEHTYKVRTNDIELHYTHYVGLSGDLKVNTYFEHKNASEFINKTYEHRMLLFREICNLQKQIDTGGACEETKMFHSAL